MYKLRAMNDDDWTVVREIYLEGIATGHATFETNAPGWEQWNASHLPFARLVLEVESEVKGWAALSRVSARQVYSGVAEVSVYISSSSRGKGFGGVLLNALIKEAEKNAIWTLQAGIFRDNESSIRLHQRWGFRVVGYRERIAKLSGVWHDTALLERRSTVVGVD